MGKIRRNTSAKLYAGPLSGFCICAYFYNNRKSKRKHRVPASSYEIFNVLWHTDNAEIDSDISTPIK